MNTSAMKPVLVARMRSSSEVPQPLVSLYEFPARKWTVWTLRVYGLGSAKRAASTKDGYVLAQVDWPRFVIGTYSFTESECAWRLRNGYSHRDGLAAYPVIGDAPLSLETPLFTHLSFFSNGGCLGTAAKRVESGELDPIEAWWMTRFDWVYPSLGTMIECLKSNAARAVRVMGDGAEQQLAGTRRTATTLGRIFFGNYAEIDILS